LRRTEGKIPLCPACAGHLPERGEKPAYIDDIQFIAQFNPPFRGAGGSDNKEKFWELGAKKEN
jgi:hypothetical protein